MRVAITGASGFMGGVLARALAALGHAVYSFGQRHPDQLGSPLPSYTQWNVLSDLRNKPEVDAVVHCAAKLGDWGNEDDYFRVNVEGTRRVFDTFSNAGQFIHVSSASVYSGDQPVQSLSEDAPVGQGLHTAYARSKAAAERMLLASGREVIILRPHIVYGPGDTTLMPRVLSARRFGCLLVPGNGRNPVSVTHIGNFVHAVERVLELKLTSGIFNIADAESPCVGELLRTLLATDGAPTRLLFIPRPFAWGAAVASEKTAKLLRRQTAPRLTRYLVSQVAGGHTLDLGRAVETLGYKPRHSYRDHSSGPDCTP